MPLSIYFSTREDTSIAAADSTFIKSLKSIADTMSGVSVADRPEIADIILVDEKYAFRDKKYIIELSACNFIRRNASKIIVVNHDDHARVFLPGLYTSLEKSRSTLVAAIAIPYKRDLWRVGVPDQFSFHPRRLYTFRGSLQSHRVRQRIMCSLAGDSGGRFSELEIDFHRHNDVDQKTYIEDILNASFSLCPRGFSPSTYRVYESMELGRCPVIISDEWCPPVGPDWQAFAIFVEEKNIGDLSERLLKAEGTAEARGQRALAEWNEHFSWPTRLRYFLERAVELHEVKRCVDFAELYDVWVSRGFSRVYEWDLTSRLTRKVKSSLSLFVHE